MFKLISFGKVFRLEKFETIICSWNSFIIVSQSMLVFSTEYFIDNDDDKNDYDYNCKDVW